MIVRSRLSFAFDTKVKIILPGDNQVTADELELLKAEESFLANIEEGLILLRELPSPAESAAPARAKGKNRGASKALAAANAAVAPAPAEPAPVEPAPAPVPAGE